MSETESDLDIQSALPLLKKLKKLPSSPQEHLVKREPKKLSTKEMIHQALTDLKSRKGVSLYAIKKYMIERFNTDPTKINFYIKKYIKEGVETGVIIQTSGVGVSGSFKLAPMKKSEKPKKLKKKKIEKPEKLKKLKMKNIEKPEKPKSKKPEKETKESAKGKIMSENTLKKKPTKETEIALKEKQITKVKKATVTKNVKVVEKSEKEPKKKINKANSDKTPAKKKKLVLKRKSIGSIVKPPKMKPKKV